MKRFAILVSALAIALLAIAPRDGIKAQEAATQYESGQEIFGLTGVVWQWQNTTLNDGTTFVPTDPTRYTIEFMADGSVTGQADCNRLNGPYTVAGNQISIGPLATTLALCPPGSAFDRYIMQLQQVTSFFLSGGDLVMELPFDSGSMVFSPAGSGGQAILGLTGIVWEWQNTTLNDGTVFAPADPSRYTIEFLEDGTVTGTADCNRISGGFSVTGNRITIGPLITTLIACPPGSLDQPFLRQLQQVSSFFILGSDLVMELPFDSGSMVFSPQGSGGMAIPGLTGVTWQWANTRLSDGTAFISPDPDRYTIEFTADGRVAGIADCNRFMGGFTVSGNQITIGPLATTLALCPPGSLGSTFTAQLEQVSSFFITGGSLVLELRFDSGQMVFIPGQGAARAPDEQAHSSIISEEARYAGLSRVRGDAVSATTAQGSASWLDQNPPANWNQPNAELPAPPRLAMNLDIRCLQFARMPELDEDWELNYLGWIVIGQYVGGWGIRVVTATSDFDGMCRPLGFQQFVFVNGRFAGTVSPEVMNSRADGAATVARINGIQEIVVSFLRYTEQDALCCPSATSTVIYRIDRSGGAVVLTPTTVTMSPTERG